MDNKYYSWFIIGLAIVFVIAGNWIYQPVSFDISLKAVGVKTFWAVLGMLILPLGTIKYLFKKNASEFGFKRPADFKKALKLLGIFIGLNLPVIFLLSKLEDFQSYYRLLDNSLNYFLLSVVAGGLVYYVAEEFLFRGFLFLGLYDQLGSKSYWVTSLIFAAAHWSKSYVEIIYSFGISWWLCWLTLKTKSFWPAAIAHFALALILNILVNYLVIS